MKKLALALFAASTLISAPALAVGHDNGNQKSKGNAYGHYKVCLVTFEEGTGTAGLQSNDFVVNAEYLPLHIANRKKAESDLPAYTFNYDAQQIEGVDYQGPNYVNSDGAQATCEMLDDMAEDNDDIDDDE